MPQPSPMIRVMAPHAMAHTLIKTSGNTATVTTALITRSGVAVPTTLMPRGAHIVQHRQQYGRVLRVVPDTFTGADPVLAALRSAICPLPSDTL